MPERSPRNEVGILRDALGWPHNLTHCGGCDQPFDEPVEQWDDYFTEVEDAGFLCASCALAEGIDDVA